MCYSTVYAFLGASAIGACQPCWIWDVSEQAIQTSMVLLMEEELNSAQNTGFKFNVKCMLMKFHKWLYSWPYTG